MSQPFESDYYLLQEAVKHLSSSLELSQVMRAAFQLLSRHFPIDGFSFHIFEHELSAQHILFVVTRKDFHLLDELIDLPREACERVREQELSGAILNNPHSFGRIISRLHGRAISPYLPDKDRARLVAVLRSNHRVVGHLSLIGSAPECFSEVHERKLAVVEPVFSLFMINLLQHREILQLRDRLAEQNRQLAGEVRSLKQRHMIGNTGGLRQITEMLTQLSGQDAPVLITGETGTGKEVIADAVQQISSRHEGPYVKVNCGAIPDTLIDSELFGHEKGAFTGATHSRPGRFEQAHGGTLFLDEIGDMPLNVQVRLLRVLQNGVIERVGGTQSIRVDVRIIAATHQDLKKLIKSGRFREDLYYRLHVFPIRIPPLRERAQDIPALVHHFIQQKSRHLNLARNPVLSREALPDLEKYPWPGNIRELENLVERALLSDPEGPLNLHLHLPSLDHDSSPAAPATVADAPAVVSARGEGRPPVSGAAGRERSPLPKYLQTTREAMSTLEHAMAEHIQNALSICNGKIHGPRGAAELLGINSNTLRKRMDKLGMTYGRRVR